MQKIFIPSELLIPIFLYHPSSLSIILVILAKVSVLLMIVGLSNNPLIAGKGGLILGIPRLPSIDSNIAVSSPTI